MIDSMEQEDFDIRNQQPVTSRERDFENALRPLNFEDFQRQDKVVDNLRIFCESCPPAWRGARPCAASRPSRIGKNQHSAIS